MRSDGDMKSVARGILERLGREIGVQTVAVCYRLENRLEGRLVVGCRERIRIAKVDLVLTGSLLVIGALREDIHLLQRQIYLAAYILPPVIGCDIHISGMIVRLQRALSVLIAFEQVKFHPRTEGECDALGLCRLDGTGQDAPAVTFAYAAVQIAYGAVHPDHTPVIGTPREDRQRIGIRHEIEIQVLYIAEARDGLRIERDAVPECLFNLAGHDGYVFLLAVDITKCKTDELDILLDKLHDFLRRIFHD